MEVAGLRTEETINGSIEGIGPTVRYRFEAGGWLGLAFAYVSGRHADLSPGTKDLDAVASVLTKLQNHARPFPPVPRFADRFTTHLLPGERLHLEGPHLLHTDINPHNILIAEDGDPYLVDWAMPATGPAWIDLAYTAVRLIECDQTAEVALAWLARFPGWQRACPEAVEAFVNVTCRHWTATVGERGAAASNARYRMLLNYRHDASSRRHAMARNHESVPSSSPDLRGSRRP
ncbi:phosphotransferase [Streptomyces sp. M19]